LYEGFVKIGGLAYPDANCILAGLIGVFGPVATPLVEKPLAESMFVPCCGIAEP
jgi:hypothetical protein